MKCKKKLSPPKHFNRDTENCWCCKNRNACGNCKLLKKAIRKQKDLINRKEKRLINKDTESE